MSYSFNTHTIQVPNTYLLNYLKDLCIEFGIEYKIYYLSKYNINVYWEEEPNIPESQYNIELDFMVEKKDNNIMEFVKYLYYKHCDNIMELESNMVNDNGVTNNAGEIDFWSSSVCHINRYNDFNILF